MAVGTSKEHEPWLLDEEERLGYDALLGEDEHYPLIDQIPGTEDDAHRGYEDPPPRTRGRRLATSGRLAPPLFDDMGLECAQCDTCAAPSAPTLGLGGEGGGRGGPLEVAWTRWENEWHARLEEWWTRLPSIDQAAMHQCLGALGLFRAARFDQTLRRLRLPPRAPSALFESEEGCDFVRRGEGSTSAVLPEFPELPSVTTPEAFMATPFLLCTSAAADPASGASRGLHAAAVGSGAQRPEGRDAATPRAWARGGSCGRGCFVRESPRKILPS